MAEEHRCQAPRLCANNCGFFGSPATQDLCSKCHRDLQLKEQQSSTAVLALNQSLAASSSSTPPSPPPSSVTDLESMGVVTGGNQSGESRVKAKAKATRCVTCRRRVGLTGFECRCGMTFCGSHRYPEQHGCTFDFKGMGREQIAQANPVIKAEKLDRI